MYLGDSAHLTLTLVDDQGNPTDGAGVTLTLRLPDGSTSDQTGLIQHDDVGAYHADYVTTQPGRHLARWHSDPPAPAALEEPFNVAPQWTRALVSLAEVKAHLNLSTTTPAQDAELRGHITAVTPLVELRVGPVATDITPRDEWFDGGAPTIALLHRPVVSVQSVTETFGANIIRTLTEQALDGVTAVDAYGYTIDKDTGIVSRRVSGIAAPFAGGLRNVHVVYTAGRQVVPENLQLAVKIVVAHLWETQRGKVGGRGPSPNSELVAVPGYGFLVPRRALELLDADPYAGNFGIA